MMMYLQLTPSELFYGLSDFSNILSVLDAITNLNAYFSFYNHKRLHQSLNYRTPAIMYLVKPGGQYELAQTRSNQALR